jgi:lipopolysaccharide heptosyltransferase II
MEVAQQVAPTLEAVLVMGPNWVGDAVMSTPVLANLRRGLPKAKIELLVPAYVAPLFEEHPHVDRVLIHGQQPSWRECLAQVRALRHRRYDVALLLPNSLRAALWAWMIRPPIRIGYATDGRRWLLTHPISAEDVQPFRRRGAHGCQAWQHQIEAYLRLLASLQIPVVERLPLLARSNAAEAEAERLWACQGLRRDERIIGICPGAAFGPAKRWWPERFAALADRLMERLGIAVGLFGSAAEAPLIDDIRSRMSQPAISFAGQDTLGSFMALAARCRVLITNDSGAMHIASAVGTPVVAMFGPTDPRRTAPMNPHATVLRHEVRCSPCFRTICPFADHPCMRLIEVEEVYEAVLHRLGMGHYS